MRACVTSSTQAQKSNHLRRARTWLMHYSLWCCGCQEVEQQTEACVCVCCVLWVVAAFHCKVHCTEDSHGVTESHTQFFRTRLYPTSCVTCDDFVTCHLSLTCVVDSVAARWSVRGCWCVRSVVVCWWCVDAVVVSLCLMLLCVGGGGVLCQCCVIGGELPLLVASSCWWCGSATASTATWCGTWRGDICVVSHVALHRVASCCSKR